MNKYTLAILLSLSVPSAYAEVTPDIKEGLWEITSKASIVGMPMKIPAMTQKECFTKQSMNPANILQQNNCEMNNMDVQPSSVNWSMSCQQQGVMMQGSGKIQYQKTSFSGTFDMTMSGSGQGAMGMHTELTGRYVGRCP